MKTLVYLLLVVSVFCRCAYSQTNTSYCSQCANHTLCIYSDTPAPRCNQVISSGATAAEITTILNRHNFYRTKVAAGNETQGDPGPQPAAANMRILEWDTELATISRVWSEQCIISTDECRSVQRFPVGQNVYWTACIGGSCNSSVNWNECVDNFYSGVKDFDPDNIDPFQFTSSTGGYTQVVWATTKYIGCSSIVFITPNGWRNKLCVCNYGRAGNYVGTRVYKKGPPCSSCTPNTCSANGVLCN